MSIHVALHHVTQYEYDRPVSLSPHIFRLRPAAHSRTSIESYSLRIEPSEHFINWQQDPFGNYLARVVFPEKASKLRIEVDLIADMTVINPFDFFLDEAAEKYPFSYDEQLRRDLAPYFSVEENGPLLTKWLKSVDRTPKETVPFLAALNMRLCNDIRYSVRMEPGVQTCEETLGNALGSCRDTGWLLVQILRHLGLAARFVSGYLVQLVADEKSLDGPSGPEQDFTDLHAWAEVYIPGAGWVGLDATSGLFAGEGHIPLACTPSPQSASPVTGATDPCKTEFSFANEVTRVHEDPRVTKPYSDAQWAQVEALGNQVDADLQAGDVRLTMGGEPTFVSIDDMESEQWNTAADGDDKLRLANDLMRRLGARFAPGGLLHYGQGKWYPGEQLPRWQYSCFWRTDNEPLWHNQALLAEPDSEGSAGVEDAHRFAEALATQLGVVPAHATPAYEDVFYYMWREGTLPEEVDALAADLKDPLERQYLAKLLDRGMGEPTGYVLPLRWHLVRKRWESSAWEMRRKHVFLVPGGSAMGLRLPLDSLPEPEDEPLYERSPLEAQPPLGAVSQPVGAAAPEGEVVHTALCIEPRDGHLHLFLPPLPHLETYVELISAIEKIAAKLESPVVVEGYEPPHDARLQRLRVTPDPGVIEVNIHPAHSWQELVQNTTALYEEARLARLGTEKFMIDGRHTGTGGGNHITI
jgi:transglutaminase-like putative cysteine protease